MRGWLRTLGIVITSGCVGLPPQPPADDVATIALGSEEGLASSDGAVTTSGEPTASISDAGGATTEVADSGTTTTDASSSGSECLEECPLLWVCVGGGCVNPDEGEPCLAGCGPAAPFCTPDGMCYDGTFGDPCNEDQCQAPLLCGPRGCQAGEEGDACDEPTDCGDSTPLCAGGQCQDGSDGDQCTIEDDCAGDLLCGPANACQDGDEGDPCAGPDDCGAVAPYCPWDDLCHDGSSGDPCITSAQCKSSCYMAVCGV